MKIKILKGVLYTLFFFVCLAFFLVRGFPVHLLADRLTREVEQRFGMRLTTGPLSTLFPIGVQASDLRLIKEGRDEGQGLVVPVEQVKARLSLLGLLGGRQDVGFSAELFSGRVEGEVRLDAEQRELTAQLSGLDLARLPIWKDLLGLELAGKLSGELDVQINPKDLKATTGTIVLTLEQGTLGEGSIKGLSIPKIALGKTQIDLGLGKGKADIKTFKVQSDDVEASLSESYLLLQKELHQTNARGKVRFKLTEDFLARNPKFKDLIQLAGLNQARADDGFFTYQVFGRIDHLQFRPQRGAGGRPGAGSPLVGPASKPLTPGRPGEARAEFRPGSRPEPKPVARPEPKPEPPPEAKPVPGAEPPPEPPSEPPPEPPPEPEPAPESDSEATPDPPLE